MKKLVVTIPAYNEAETIGHVITSIPRSIEGISKVEVLVLNDGSTDDTIEVAKKAGADYIVSHKQNLGLAKTFDDALTEALKRKADIIVNTDADGQYDQSEISQLVQPILEEKADMVIGDRQVKKLDWMTSTKKYGNIVGSAVVRWLTGINVNDASSGFRAMSAHAARKFNLVSGHTYTHDTIVQAAHKDITIVEVPITFSKRAVGQSRLITNVFTHINKSLATIVRSILMYRAFAVMTWIGALLLVTGFLLSIRYLWFFYHGSGAGHVQSLLLAAVVVIVGVNTIFLGVLADLISHNRKILEDIYERLP